MARLELSEAVQDTAGNAISGATVQVNVRGGAAATLYSAETGATTVGNPRTTDTAGRIEAWVNDGQYDLVVSKSGYTSYTLPFDAVPAGDFAITKEAPLNVQYPEFGCLGDGTVTNENVGINAAIVQASTSTTGGEVFVPPGLYKLAASLVQYDGVTLTGGGHGSSSPEFTINPASATTQLEHGGATNFPLITNEDTTNGNTALRVKGFRLNMGAATSDVAAIKWQMIRRSDISDIYVQCPDTLSAQPTSRNGIHILFGERLLITDQVFLYNCGIRGTDVNAVTIRDTEIGMGGISLAAGFYNQIRNCQIYSDNVTTGTDYSAWRNGILLDGAHETQVIGNEVNQFRHDGIYLSGCERCKVIGNDSLGNSKLTAGTWGGLLLDNGCQKNIVSLNHFFDRQGTKTQQYGIRVLQSSGTTTNNMIVRNFVSDNLAADGIFVAAAATGNVIADNIGDL